MRAVAIVWGSMQADMISLSLPQVRLEFSPIKRGAGFGFGLSIRDGENSEKWRVVSAMDNPLVRGATFDLFPSDVRRRDDRTLELSGRAASGVPFRGIVRTDVKNSW